MRYIARKYKSLAPKTEKEFQMTDVAEGALSDLRFAFGGLCYNPNFEKLKSDFLKDLPNKLKGLEKVLEKQEWVAGRLTYIDFGICERLDTIVTCFPGCFDSLP